MSHIQNSYINFIYGLFRNPLVQKSNNKNEWVAFNLALAIANRTLINLLLAWICVSQTNVNNVEWI